MEYAAVSNRRHFHKQSEEKIDIQGDCLTPTCMYEEVVKKETKRRGEEERGMRKKRGIDMYILKQKGKGN